MTIRALGIAFWVMLLAACGQDHAADVEAAERFTGLDAFEGEWSGDLAMMGQSLPLVLRVEPEAKEPVVLISLSQTGKPIVATNAFGIDNTLTATFRSIRASYQGDLSDDGGRLEGTFKQGPLSGELVLTRNLASATQPKPVTGGRPQEPRDTTAYETRGVPVRGDPRLAGTLTLPKGEGPFPGLVLITGSGPQDRDESILGHRPFLVLADRLARAGVATYRYDERGVGESAGNYEASSVREFAEDAARAIRILTEVPEVSSVGYLGHSEGGIVAALASVDPQAVSPEFIVFLAAPFQPFDVLINEQARKGMEAAGQSGPILSANMAIQRSIMAAAKKGDTPEEACASIDAATNLFPAAVKESARDLCSPSFFTALRLDPEDVYSAVDGPSLAIFGSVDQQVPAAPNAALARDYLGDNVRIEIIENANHLFQTSQSGAPSEYGKLDETMREDVMELIGAFVLSQEPN